MTGFNKRIYEMLVRVSVFATTYPQFFQQGTISHELIGRIQIAADKLSSNAAAQQSGRAALKQWAAERAKARKALRDQLDAIAKIARGMKLTQFWLPRDRGDIATLSVGHAFVRHLEPLKPLFIENQLPGDFIGQLGAAIQKLEQAIKDQALSKGTRLAATATIDQARNDALEALQRLDPILENILRNDPPVLAVWESARHVARYGVAKDPGEQIATAAPSPPVTAASDASTARS
jgi:hypothetical protein